MSQWTVARGVFIGLLAAVVVLGAVYFAVRPHDKSACYDRNRALGYKVAAGQVTDPHYEKC